MSQCVRDLQLHHALLQFWWSCIFKHDFFFEWVYFVHVWQLITCSSGCVCLGVSCWSKWECRIREVENNPHVSLSSTERNIAFAACCEALTNKRTQTEYPANRKIIMSDLLMPSDSSNCSPACSYPITINAQT